MTSAPRTAGLRRALVAVALVGVALTPMRPAAAHDMPNEIMLHTFVKPEGDRLHVLARAPLATLLDMRLPKRGPGYIDLAVQDQLGEALDNSAVELAAQIRLFENGEPLVLERQRSRLSLPADRSFASYEEAVAHVAGPDLPVDTNLFWNQGYFDVHLEYAIGEVDSGFALQTGTEPEIARRLHVLITYLAPDGGTRSYDILGDAGRVALDPEWYEAARLFATAGWWRALTGWEQLVFLLVVALPFRRSLRGLGRVAVVLVPAVGLAAVPAVATAVAQQPWVSALVGSLVAVSILVLAIGNLVSRELRWRWLTAGGWGLAHGAALASGLDGVLQFGGDAMVVALAAYILAVYAGLAAALLAMLVALRVLFRHQAVARHGVLVAGLLIGHQAWHWAVERIGVLAVLPPPPVDVMAVAAVARVLVLSVLALAVGWLIFETVLALAGRRRPAPAEVSEPEEITPVGVGARDRTGDA